MSDRSANLRDFFARYVTLRAGVRDPRIEHAFASVKREPFAGPGPWFISVAGHGYLKTPNDDPAFIYQDTLVAIDTTRGINIGEPSLHARCLGALALHEGDTVLQVGAGVGYYTALLAHLVGPGGKIHAYEIDSSLAARAKENLAQLRWVDVQARSGIADHLPKVDAVYVNAGITQPSWAWLDALRPGGRLIFPLQAVGGAAGAMLLIKRPERGMVWPARFITQAAFMSCEGPQDEEAGHRFAAAFSNGAWDQVQSFRIDEPIDGSCWLAGDGWWLSTATHVDPKVFKDYVGRYELAPSFVLNVTREADRLFVQATGQPRLEVFAESEQVYRCRGVDARLTFETDRGRVVRLILHQGGKDTPAERIE
jgi:protein-L-isoaspartate(D-aspartate) O-methyltransferase